METSCTSNSTSEPFTGFSSKYFSRTSQNACDLGPIRALFSAVFRCFRRRLSRGVLALLTDATDRDFRSFSAVPIGCCQKYEISCLFFAMFRGVYEPYEKNLSDGKLNCEQFNARVWRSQILSGSPEVLRLCVASESPGGFEPRSNSISWMPPEHSTQLACRIRIS